jgi:hypothetical protein
MSDIQITLNRAQIREVVAAVRERIGQGPVSQDLADVDQKLRAALPPEYPEGTIAWVTGVTGHRTIAWREDGRWMTNRDEGALATSYFPDHNVTKVEPLRVLADDEIAVKMPEGYSTSAMRYGADALESTGNPRLAQWVRQVADAFEAEKK